MYWNPPTGTITGRMSPAARAVLERLVNGTLKIDLDRLVDALLDDSTARPNPTSPETAAENLI